ncbi:DUF748 domain-containing protein [Candidatus Electronema sp. PJ]|uniref:DUF748 domain-containing protein n=1 Tax=Candidatus Electronema sp. PJ TaxID=3401572 RepID=UPI003AA994D8
MIDEKKDPNSGKKPDFGEIQIRPGGLAAPVKPNRPPKAVASPPEKAAQRQKGPRVRGKARFLLLLLLPLVVLLVGLIGVYYLLPLYIQGPLAEQLGRQLGRPVIVKQASLSPFSFALQLREITLGPAIARPDEPELARIEAIDARLRPMPLLKGQVLLDDVRIDRLRANLIRRQDGSFNALPPGRSLFNGLNFLPSWLQAEGLRLHRSTVHFLDQPSGKKHLLEHIELFLPPAGQGQEPTLSAVVNASPLQLTGQKQADASQSTRLTLKLDDLDPQLYLGLIPGMAELVNVSAKRTDAVLEVILQDAAGNGPAITGSVSFSELLVQSAEHEEQPEQAFQLASPTAHAIIRFNPMQKLYTVDELLLEEPQLDLPESQEELLDSTELAAKAAVLLNPEQIGLIVQRLSVSKGRVKSSHKEWTEVQAELTGFQNSTASTLAKESETSESLLSFSAINGNSNITFKGHLDPLCNLNGSLSLQNMRADLLRPYLSPGEWLRFSKGTADITGELQLAQEAEGKTSITISDSTITARDFVLQQKKAALLTGKLFNGTDCLLNGAEQSMSCGKVLLEGAAFAETSFFLPNNKKGKDSSRLHFSCNNLELKNASAQLPFGPARLPLSGLHLTLTGLGEKQQPGQISLEAGAGKQGKISLNGTSATSKDGLVLLSGKLVLKNAEADLLHSYLAQGDEVHFSQGSADLSGNFNLNGPALNLSNGTIAVRDFSLQRSDSPLLSGKAVNGTDCALDSGNQRMTCGKITAEGTDFADSSFFLQPAGRLRLAANTVELKNSSAKFALGAATLPLSGLNLTLTGLKEKQPGQISLKAATQDSGQLELNGTAAHEATGLALSGTITLRNSSADVLQPYLGEGLSLSQGRADLSGSFHLGGSVLNVSGSTISLRDFILQKSGTALLSAQEVHGQDCTFDGHARSLTCGSVTAKSADFAETGFFLHPAGRLRFAAQKVELQNSVAQLALGGAMLPLSGLQLSLSGLPGQIKVEATTSGSGKLEINGTVAKEDSGLTLSGQLALKNADAALLNSYLGDTLRFSSGRVDLAGIGRLHAGEEGAKLYLASGNLAIRDFSLQHEGAALLSGQSASGADCSLEAGLSCSTIAVEQADFAAAAAGFFFRPTGGLHLAANAVEISSSSALLPVGSALLPLSGLKMSVTGLRDQQASQNNLQFVAAVGQGSLKATGQLHKDGSALAELTAERLDIRLFNKAFASLLRDELTIKQGSLSGKGEFKLPETRFSGNINIDHFVAETSRGDSLRWRRATTDKASLVLTPFAAVMETLSLEEPLLQLAAADSSMPAGLFALFAELPQLAVEQCSLSSGSLQRSGQSDLSFNGIQGQIGPIKPGASASFSFTGKMGGSDFAASGKTDTSNAAIDQLTVEQLPLPGAAKELAKQLALDSSRGTINRTVSATGDRLDFSGFVPLPKSDYAFALALLTEQNGAFSIPLQSMPFTVADEVLVQAVVGRFQQLSASSPWTALEKLLPNLPKSPDIDFLPGEKVPDFMAGLESLRPFFSTHPHLGWTVQGCYDQEADRKALLAQAQKNGGQKVEEENARRKQELDRLLAQEVLRQMTLTKLGLPIVKDQLPEIKARQDLQPLPMPQAELPEHVLPDLARARAEVVREQLISKLGLSAERVKLEESGTCGAKAGLIPAPVW